MRTAHASETTMKGEQGRGGAVKVFGEVSKDRADAFLELHVPLALFFGPWTLEPWRQVALTTH
jgi:hypothetical protein